MKTTQRNPVVLAVAGAAFLIAGSGCGSKTDDPTLEAAPPPPANAKPAAPAPNKDRSDAAAPAGTVQTGGSPVAAPK